MNLNDLLVMASDKAVKFVLEGEIVRVFIPDDVPQFLQNRLRAHQKEIVAYLEGDNIVDCCDCGRATSKLVRIRGIGTRKLFKLCWPCHEERYGVSPIYEWNTYPPGKTPSAKNEARKKFHRHQAINPYLTRKAIAGDEPFSLASFFRDHLKIDAAGLVRFQEVCETYLEWAARNHIAVVPLNIFTEFVEKQGCERIDIDGLIHFSNLEPTCLSPEPNRRWNTEIKALAERILSLTRDDLPPAPFEFRQGETVVDSEKFLTAFQNGIRYGQDHPRARTGVLQDEMRILWMLLNPYGSGIG